MILREGSPPSYKGGGGLFRGGYTWKLAKTASAWGGPSWRCALAGSYIHAGKLRVLGKNDKRREEIFLLLTRGSYIIRGIEFTQSDGANVLRED